MAVAELLLLSKEMSQPFPNVSGPNASGIVGFPLNDARSVNGSKLNQQIFLNATFICFQSDLRRLQGQHKERWAVHPLNKCED